MRVLATVAILGAMATAASARNIEVPTGQTIPVCVQGVATRVNIRLSEDMAAKMFAGVGVRIQWKGWNSCPADALRISLSEQAPETDHPHAYAYALPAEGTHIVIFWDRVASGADERSVPYLLAHVMVHEITHILQGVCRHSETGVMKAVFRKVDIEEMELHPLPFAPEDVVLIHSGLQFREARLARHGAEAAVLGAQD
jgi:hypothetical protein